MVQKRQQKPNQKWHPTGNANGQSHCQLPMETANAMGMKGEKNPDSSTLVLKNSGKGVISLGTLQTPVFPLAISQPMGFL